MLGPIGKRPALLTCNPPKLTNVWANVFTPKLYTLFLPIAGAFSCNLGFDLCKPTFLAINPIPLADIKNFPILAASIADLVVAVINPPLTPTFETVSNAPKNPDPLVSSNPGKFWVIKGSGSLTLKKAPPSISLPWGPYPKDLCLNTWLSNIDLLLP